MPKLTAARMHVDEGLRMRELARAAGQDDPVFSCPECGARVRPHAAGGHAAAHYEHDDRDIDCSLSDPPR